MTTEEESRRILAQKIDLAASEIHMLDREVSDMYAKLERAKLRLEAVRRYHSDLVDKYSPTAR